MFRRSRFSVRPNVGTVGKTAATPQDAPSANQEEASETPKDVGESSTAAAKTDNESVVTPSEKPTASGDGNDQNVEGTSSSAAVQRRKRFSIKPKVAPGRPSAAARTQKSPIKAVSGTSIEVPVSDHDKPDTSSQTGTTVAPQRLQSPRRRRPSEESKLPKTQPKSPLIPSDASEPLTDSTTNLPADSGKELESTSDSQVKEVPSRLPDKFPPSLPDKQAIELSEKAKTLVSSQSGLSLSPSALSLSRLLNDPSDLQRIAKAQKLRELLREEMHKEKKLKKGSKRVKEFTLDPAKMTMRDLIRYLPQSNPMTSTVEEPAQENETVVPPSPVREASPEKVQEPVVLPKIGSPREVEEGEEEEDEDEDDDDGMMVPQVKVAEDGSLIIDEESLTVEVQRAKGPNPAQDRDPIFERGSTTTYASFRKGTYTKPWSSEETDMFFLAISMVGTDFSMICQLFPLRARSEIKNKFKKEERQNSWRVDKAFRERRKLDIEYFSKLLEKILEVQKNRKKLKSLAVKKSPKKTTRKAKGKKAARKLSVVEEEDEEEQNKNPDLEEEGEKENEVLCNEGGADVAKPKKKRKRKAKEDASTEEPNDKKNKKGEKSNKQDEASIPGDTEAALPEDCPKSDMSEKTESVNEAKDAKIKPAKLSRGRAPKPLLPLGRKWGKKPPPPSTKANDTASDKGDESVTDGGAEDQVNKDASPSSQADKKKSANDDSEEETANLQPPKPTRYGRVPKPIQLLNYPAKDDASEAAPASPEGSTAPSAKPKPKCTAKRGRSSKLQSSQESKKPKLVTLRASQSEYSDEEDVKQREEEEEDVEEVDLPLCGSSKDSSAPVFVPVGLRSPQPVISEVEETMEELDILANIPDVLGISQDALCHDASCEGAQNETGTAEPCEHQLDLLVDVIDFLSSDHTEVSQDESYNEAAQTLLTISSLAHLPQSEENEIAIQDHTTGTTVVDVKETSQHFEEKIASKPAVLEGNGAAPLVSATSDHDVIETSESVTIVELQSSTTDGDDIQVIESIDQRTDSDFDATPQLQSPESSKTNSPKTKTGRSSKVKPKPNIGLASRTAQSKPQPGISTKRTAEKSRTVGPGLSETTETLSAAEETPKIADCSKTKLKDEISCIEVKHTEDPSCSQKRSVGEFQSDAATSDQSASENQIHFFSEAQLEPSLEQDTGDARSTSGSTDEVLMSHVGTIESIGNNQVTSETVTESQTGQGSNIHSPPVQESSDHPVPCVTPVEELPVGQKEDCEVGSTQQTRRSRFQKVKPKLNLAQTSRTVRSKSQTIKDTVEKDCNPTPNPKLYEKTAEVEAEPTCTISPEKTSSYPDPASDLIPPFDLGSTLTATEELSATEEKKTDVGVVGHVESDAATLHQRASENQSVSESQFEPRREQASRGTRPTSESTNETLMSHVGTAERSCINLLPSDAAVTESQTGQGSNIHSVPESSDLPVPCVTPVEELPVSQKEESEVGSTQQTRRSRFQKVKPKLSLAQTSRTARSKSQTTKDTVEKDCNPTPTPKVHEKTRAETEAEPTCTISPEQTSSYPDPASDLIPSLDLGSILTATEELSATEEKKTDVEDVGHVESDAATSHQRASENQNLSEAQFEPSREQTTRHTKPILESSDEKLMSHVWSAESSCNDPQLTSDSAVTESQVGQESSIDTAPVQESNDQPAPCVTPVEELPVSQKKENEVGSTQQTRRSRFQKVKPKPNLAQTSRTARSKPQTTKDPVTPMQHAEKPSTQTSRPESTDIKIAMVEAPSQIESTSTSSVSEPSMELCSTHKTTEEMSSTEEQKTDVGGGLDLNSEGSQQNVPQRRRRFPNVKPNLGSSPRTTHAKLQSSDISKPSKQCHMDTSSTSEQQSVDSNNAQTERDLTRTDCKHLTSTLCSSHTELFSSTTLRTAESDKTPDSPNDKGVPSGSVAIATSRDQSVFTDLVLDNKSIEKLKVEGESIGDKMANIDKVEAGPSSQLDCKWNMSSKATESNTQLTDDPTAVSDVQSAENFSTKSMTESLPPTESIPDPTESTQQPLTENDFEAQSKDALQQCSETNQQTAAQSTDDKQSDPTDSPTRKAPQTRRGQLIKPKPSLVHSSRPPQPRQVQKTKQTKTDLGACSEGVDASVCHKLVSDFRPDIPDPAEGAIEQCSNQSSSPNDSGSSLGSLTQVPDNSTQDSSTSNTGLTLFPDMLSQPEPLDPEEPFFILALTEIPVCSLSEPVDSVPEPLTHLPATDASVEQQSVPEKSLAAAGEGPLSNVTEPASMEESGETGLINVQDTLPDPAACVTQRGRIMENPVEPHESTTVHPSKLPETLEDNDETEIPPTNPDGPMMGSRRTAKAQAKPKTTKRKQASKTPAAKEAGSIPIRRNTTEDSELPGPSMQPKACAEVFTEPQKGSGDHVDVAKETRTGGDDPEDSSSGAQTTLTRVTRSRNRKPPASDSPPGKAASKSPKVRAPRAARKRSSPAAVASTSHDVAPTRSATQPTEETHSTSFTASPTQTQHSQLCSVTTPKTSVSPDEVSASQESDSVESSSVVEEPTNVSQYFLSDIFTEVEEG